MKERSRPMTPSFKEGGRKLDKIVAATIGLIIAILGEVLKDDDEEEEEASYRRKEPERQQCPGWA